MEEEVNIPGRAGGLGGSYTGRASAGDHRRAGAEAMKETSGRERDKWSREAVHWGRRSGSVVGGAAARNSTPIQPRHRRRPRHSVTVLALPRLIPAPRRLPPPPLVPPPLARVRPPTNSAWALAAAQRPQGVRQNACKMSSSYDSSKEEFDMEEEEDLAMILAMHINKRPKHGGSVMGRQKI